MSGASTDEHLWSAGQRDAFSGLAAAQSSLDAQARVPEGLEQDKKALSLLVSLVVATPRTPCHEPALLVHSDS